MSSFETMLERYGVRLTPRQWRLFACACVRRVPVVTGGSSGAVIDLAERFADGGATAHQLASARYSGRFQAGNAAWAVCWDPNEEPRSMAQRAINWAAGLLGEIPSEYDYPPDPRRPMRRDHTNELPLFLDIAGHLTEPVQIDPIWLAWDGGTVRHLAATIYDERAWDRMPILADALEDAGCQDDRILDHCRSGASHVLGCWVLDLLLEK